MDKQQIIAFIEGQLATGKITKDDLLSLSGSLVSPSESFVSASPSVENVSTKEDTSKSLINTFYGIGGIIAIIGVAILVAQNWNDIGFGGRIIATLGVSLVTYVVGLLVRNPEQKMLSQVMFVMAAVLAPLGSYVLLKEASIDFTWTTQLTTSILLAVVFGFALFVSKKNILVLITTAFASWAYYALIMKVFGFNYYDSEILKWASMLLGVSYILIGYGFHSVSPAVDLQDEKEKEAVQNIFSGLGTFAILAAGISIGGVFDLVLIILIFGAFYGSVYLKSRSMLTMGAFFLVAHILKLTSKHFADSIGWSLALIVVGFLVIGVGYMTLYLNKKFISVK